MNSEEFATKFGIHVQVVVTLLFFFETLMVTLFKAILVFYLRFAAQQTEYRAITSYHLFQTIAYFSAYITGLIAIQSVSTALVLLMVLYVVSAACLAAGFLSFTPGDVAMPFVIALFGLGHGALKSVIHRMMKVELIGKAFAAMSFLLLFLEFILLLFLPWTETFDKIRLVILALLAVVFVLLLVAILGSLFDTHPATDYSLVEVVSATYYGLTAILVAAQQEAEEELRLRMLRGQKRPKGQRRVPEITREQHWMDRCLPTYPAELVQDLKQKFRLHKFYWTMAGLWVAVEVKYSYWIFNAYFTDRVVDAQEESVIQPPQYLALTPLVFLTFGPLFYLYLRPILSKSFYNSALRQMCLGAFIILIATGLGWRLSTMQWELTTEFMEADDSQQKVRLLNAYDCQSGFQYYFPMNSELGDIYRPMPALDMIRVTARTEGKRKRRERRRKRVTATETLMETINATTAIAPDMPTTRLPPIQRERYIPEDIEMITNIMLPTIDDSFLRYANIHFLDEARIGDVLHGQLTPTDSFNYHMSVDSARDHSVTIAAYAYCETLDEFKLQIPVMHNRSQIDQMPVYLVHYRKSVQAVAFHGLDYRRDLLQKPGVRLVVAFDETMVPVTLMREGRVVATFRRADVMKQKDANETKEDEVEQETYPPPSPVVWLTAGDGPNLVVRTKGRRLQFNYTLGTAEMVDVLVAVRDNGDVVVKLLHALRPVTVSGLVPLAHYLLIPFGEFLLGIVGLQQLLALAPEKMRYHVYVDWYLVLGCANLVILIVAQIGLPLMFVQLNRLNIIVLFSFIFMLLMVARY